MAQAYKCDICGQLYDTCHNLYLGTSIKAWLNNRHSVSYDICPVCIDAIQKTIDQRMNINTKGGNE